MRASAKLPPPRIVRLVDRIRTGFQKLHRRSAPPQVAMLELVMAGWLSQAVHVAAKLGIADELTQGPRSVEDLAATVGADPGALHRLLRALAQYDVFVQLPDGRFDQSRMSDALRRQTPGGSVRGFALYLGSAEHHTHWSALDRAVQTGASAIPALRGMAFFDYVRTQPTFGRIFNDAMTSVADLAREPVLAAYDFSRYRTIVDVGGGHGRLLAGILAQAPGARGVLFDLPEVVAGAERELAESGAAERCRIEPGSFFERVPADGDAYVLKHILHDWDDTRATQILQRVREAIPGTGKLLLVESVIPEDASFHIAKLIDLEMLLSVGGKERTRAEFTSLLAGAGFSLERVVETASPLCVIEARPA